jgi:hypothetical protein
VAREAAGGWVCAGADGDGGAARQGSGIEVCGAGVFECGTGVVGEDGGGEGVGGVEEAGWGGVGIGEWTRWEGGCGCC